MKEESAARGIMVFVVGNVLVNLIMFFLGFAFNLLPNINAEELSTLYPYAIIILVSALLTIALFVIIKRRKGVHSENYSRFIGMAGQTRPAVLLETYDVDHFGVKWRVEVGWNQRPSPLDSDSSMIRGYADGPYCPKDDYPLDKIVKPSLLGGRKDYWRCGICGSLYPRPKDQYRREDDVVEKIATVEFEKRVAEERKKREG